MDTLLFNSDELPETQTPLPHGFWLKDDDNSTRCIGRQAVPLFVYAQTDRFMDRFVKVWLYRHGGLRQHAIAKAFGCTQKTVSDWCVVYEEEGPAGLQTKKQGRPRKNGDPLDEAIRKLHAQGLRNPVIGQAVQLTAQQVRRRLRRMGLQSNTGHDAGRQQNLRFQDDRQIGADVEPPIEVQIEGSDLDEQQQIESDREPERGADEPEQIPAGVTLDSDPLDRCTDRAMAAGGLLQEASPFFAEGRNVPGAGALLAMPLLVTSGLLNSFGQVYGSLKPAFYGLRSTVIVLFLAALLRIQRVEHLKKGHPADLGRLLGLDRGPEMKTLRRKLTELAQRNRAAELMGDLAQKRLNRLRDALVGMLYIDGHVREYFGSGKLPPTHVARRNHVDKACTDMWVNDADGDPVFLVTSEMNHSLTQKLEDVVADIRSYCGDDRPLTIVFDRGGWSAKLFARLRALGVHILTYRKGNKEKLPQSAFRPVHTDVDGHRVQYNAHEMSVRMGDVQIEYEDGSQEPLWLRQVTRLKDDGKQTQVLTSRQDLSAAEVLYYMFNRWRQENFLKYMRTEYLIDAMPEHGTEEMPQHEDCPNPERKRLDKQIAALRNKCRRLAARIGQNTVEADAPWWRSLRCHREDQQQTVNEIRCMGREIENLQIEKGRLPERVPAAQVYERLPREKKLITDSVKMSAYQQESRLLELLRPYYARCADEGRKLLTAAFATPGDISVRGNELLITLAPQSSPHRTKAIAGLCEELNRMEAVFPGSNLRLRYAVRHQR